MSTLPNSSERPTAVPGRAWVVMVVLAAGFVMMTVNWFAISPTFGQVRTAFHVSIPQLGLLVSIFVAGYGILHIPAGLLATRIGLRTTLVVGLGLEGITAALSGLANSYWLLMVLRILCGAGTGIYAAVGIAAMSVWFTRRFHALALGVISATFGVGAALGLYIWSDLVTALGWRAALIIGGAITILVTIVIGVVYRVPPTSSARLAGTRLTRAAVRQTLGNLRLWRYGFAFLGGYGAYFAASQLLGTYTHDSGGFTTSQASIAALLITITGVPGSLLIGWLSDRLGQRRAIILGAIALQGIGLLVLPLATGAWLWLPATIVGVAFSGCFAVWQSVASEDDRIGPENIGIAIGLMLTICAVGGFALPWGFGLLVPVAGYGAAWIMLGVVTLACGLAATVGREPARLNDSARNMRAEPASTPDASTHDPLTEVP